MVSVFARLAPRLQQSIVARLGWSSLRPVQELAGDALLSGRDFAGEPTGQVIPVESKQRALSARPRCMRGAEHSTLSH